MSLLRKPRHTHTKLRIALLLAAALLAPRAMYAQLQLDTSNKAVTKRLWVGTLLLPGYGQVRNHQYWKLPVFYSAIGGCAYMAVREHKQFAQARRTLEEGRMEFDPLALNQDLEMPMRVHRARRNAFIIGASAAYAASMIDALVTFNNPKTHSPTTATILSVLTPGAGQAYNGKYWKVPIIYGASAGLIYGLMWNHKMFDRYRMALIYRNDGDPNTVQPTWAESRPDSDLEYQIEDYHRNRDLCSLGLVLLYVANILDANVDAHLSTWSVTDDDDITITPSTGLGSLAPSAGLGLTLTVKF